MKQLRYPLKKMKMKMMRRTRKIMTKKMMMKVMKVLKLRRARIFKWKTRKSPL
jgi:hypothetical protein